MKTFIALYRGSTVGSAELVAVTADPLLVAVVGGQLLSSDSEIDDPVLGAMHRGRRSAIEALMAEALRNSPSASPPDAEGGR